MAVKYKPGKHIIWHGYEWIILDDAVETPEGNGVLVIMADTYTMRDICFDNYGYNNYAKSTLREFLNNELLPELGENYLLPHVVDLTADNGDKGYGTITEKVFILSCDEYRKYRDYVPLFDEWMWTCTPWYIKGKEHSDYCVRVVSDTGILNGNYANTGHGVAPACVITSSVFNCADNVEVES